MKRRQTWYPRLHADIVETDEEKHQLQRRVSDLLVLQKDYQFNEIEPYSQVDQQLDLNQQALEKKIKTLQNAIVEYEKGNTASLLYQRLRCNEEVL